MRQKIKYQPGMVGPYEYNWIDQFNSLSTLKPFSDFDTGKVLGLAAAFDELTQLVIDLIDDVKRENDINVNKISLQDSFDDLIEATNPYRKKDNEL